MSKKHISFFIISGAVVVTGLFFVKHYFKQQKSVEINESIDRCFFRSISTISGINDVTKLLLTLYPDNTTNGELTILPAESDSKVGSFEGTVSSDSSSPTKKEASLWWNASAEGTITTEELLIDFDDDGAQVAFGEMVDRGDGVYVYKDKEHRALYWSPLKSISCDELE